MGGLLKKVVFVFLGIAALLVIVAVSFVLLFDPNNFREEIATEVQRETGRELVIEGDIDLTFFPWFAIQVGKTTLGNAPGFGDDPFASFEEARLSVGVLPMILRREVSVGAVVLDSFQLNLAVARDGRSNWQDLIDAMTTEADIDAEVPADDAPAMDIAGIEITNASVSYDDAQLGEKYSLTNFNLAAGRVTRGEPLEVYSNFDFELQPADLAGDFEIETVVVFDIEAGSATFTDTQISTLGIDMTVGFDEAAKTALIQTDAFSLKSLMERLNIEAPVTADPDALGKVIVDATLDMNAATTTVTNLNLLVDDTTFKGQVSIADDAAGTIRFNLAADSMDVDRYMAPAEEGAGAGGDSVPVEIPTDLIRALNVRGNLTFEAATLSGMKFENVTLGVNAAKGNMRLHPISASFFGGKYEGDVRINAAGSTPELSVNENVSGVDLGALAIAMFDQESVTGSINGSFKLSGAGDDLAAIQRSLNGTMSMELLDGTWEGTDVWYELRRARALYKQEPAPEPDLPPRTRFSTVRASGPVTDGVFRNDDLLAELPFMRLTGKGKVDFAAAKIDYRMSARILERPEFIEGATDAELDEFTEAVIPLKITGSLADPSITPDVGQMLKKEAEKEIKKRLLDELLDGGADESTDEPANDQQGKKKKDRDKVKDALKDLLGG
jgi:AsmA protein